MIVKILENKNKFLLFFLFCFSILINQYYGTRGVHPIDSFLHFDNAYRILNGENPFTDFWTVSGPAIDYIQAVFFYILGVNWSSYVLHASLLNGFATVFTFFILKSFKLETNYCFLYSLFFSILAYPSSGTPFVDHHSAFLSLFAIYSLLLVINTGSKLHSIFIPIFLCFAFLSKQVPAFYVAMIVIFILILYSFKNKNFSYLNYFIATSVIFIFLITIFANLKGIKIFDFLDQYIFYPQTIGSERFFNFEFTYRGVIDHLKFIYIAILPVFYVHYKKISDSKKYFKSNEIYILLILLLFTFSLILHQLLTNNQTFIFFLIPILIAFSHISLNSIKLKYKNIFNIIIIFICVFAVIKYHLKFNENRKFHELSNVNFELASDAKKIDNKLIGLKWITSKFKNKPEDEIDIINQIKINLKKDKRNKMLITNYTFFSAILDENFFAPSWAFTDNGTTHPINTNKYVKEYRKLMVDIIKKNEILVIYIAGALEDKQIYNYISPDCFKENVITNHLKSFEIKNCVDING